MLRWGYNISFKIVHFSTPLTKLKRDEKKWERNIEWIDTNWNIVKIPNEKKYINDIKWKIYINDTNWKEIWEWYQLKKYINDTNWKEIWEWYQLKWKSPFSSFDKNKMMRTNITLYHKGHKNMII